jgi:hypothetical protein
MYSGMTSGSTSSPAFPRTPALVVILVALLAVALPRLMVVGGLPTTDEGFQAYYAQIMHASLAGGHGLPDTGPLMFYSLLVNWVFAFGANPMIALRLVDMLVAVAAGYALYRVIEVESRSRLGALLIALLFLFTMNHPTFTQHGFKNSIHAAYLPLFAALWLGLTAPANATARRWLGVGALLSVAVLLRETFLPLMALGALAVLVGHGPRAFGRLVAGAAGAGLLITGVILAARGGIAATLEGYRDAGLVYAAIADKRVEFFFNYGGQALREGTVALIVAGVGLVVTLARSLGGSWLTSLPRLAFWLAAALIPLIEPASKIGFPYHFGVCLPGLAGLAALGWRNACEGSPIQRRNLAAGALGIALLAMVIPRLGPLSANWPQTREALASFQTGDWPESFTDKTNYLLAAQAIRQATPPGGTVAISGFMFTLYPLTGHVPPAPELANLSATLIKLGLSGPALRDALLRCPPDVLMTTSRTDWPGGPDLLAAVRDTGIYAQVAEIPTTNDRAYGAFGGLVFRRTEARACAH